jgi:hypothetical protein
MLKQPPQVQVHIIIDKKQLDNVEYSKYLSSLITHDVRRTHKTNSILHGKSSFNQKTFFLPEQCT